MLKKFLVLFLKNIKMPSIFYIDIRGNQAENQVIAQNQSNDIENNKRQCLYNVSFQNMKLQSNNCEEQIYRYEYQIICDQKIRDEIDHVRRFYWTKLLIKVYFFLRIAEISKTLNMK